MQITSYAMNYYNTPAQSNNKANGVENNADNSVSSGEIKLLMLKITHKIMIKTQGKKI